MSAQFIRSNIARVTAGSRLTMRSALVIFAILSWSEHLLGGIYDPSLGTLPEAQGWQFIGTSSPSPTVSQGVLHQGPTVFANVQYWDRNDIVSHFAAPEGFEIDLRLQVVSSTFGAGGVAGTWRTGFEVFMTDQNGLSVGLGIADMGFIVTNDSNNANSGSTSLISFDTTSAFHDYRLTISSMGILLRIDNIPSAMLPLGSTGGAPDFFFGDGTFGGASETNLQSLSWGSAVPEPSSFPLALLGVVGFLARFWRQGNNKADGSH